MATDFTQDAVLYFLQSSGGSVKNSDLLLHFRNFIRDHPDRDKNRDLFKKFVNSVATVKQVDGVSYVILRKKFRGHIAHGDEGVSTGPPRLPAGRSTEPPPKNSKGNPRKFADQPQQNDHQREATAPALPADTGGKILPAAGIMLNNNNVETNFNLKQKHLQVNSTPEPLAVPAAAQMVSQISEKTQLKAPSSSEFPAQDQCTRVGQRGVGIGPPPGITPVFRHHGVPSQQVLVPEPLRGREASPEPVGGLQQQPPLHHISANSQVATRRIRHRPSYKSAVSYDEDDDEEEEVSIRRGSAGGVWPQSTPLGDTWKTISTSSPCIIDPPGPHSVTSSSSSSSERKPPKIYIQGVEEETLPHGGSGWSLGSEVGQRKQWAGAGVEPGSVLRESSPTRHHLILGTERHMPSPDQTTEMAPHYGGHVDQRYSKSTSVQLEPRQEPVHNQRLSSSHSSILSPSSDTGHSSSDWPPSSSPRRLEWNSSYEDLQMRTGETKIQEVLQRVQMTRSGSATPPPGNKTVVPWHRSTGQLYDDHEPTTHLTPFHRSTDHLHDNQQSPARVLPWHLSTGDLYDDWEEAESSEGSISSQTRRQHPAVARRVSSQLRNRMCRSLGADLDQLLQEEAGGGEGGGGGGGGGGGNEAARLNRLHLISSSLCLRYNLSSSSLSSCSTPPRCHSLADLVEGVEGKGGRRSLPAASSSCNHENPSRQSLVPLEPKEHAWLVKAAAAAWPDIYSLFREDSSLLNRRDFISGFTVLHWIAKHGDHRVLNTLWYGVEKAGLTFDINARSTCGHTPLHIAALHDNRNIIRLLVSKYSADVRLRDTAGKKPWQYLKRTMPADIFKLLGAPAWAAQGQEGGVGGVEGVEGVHSSWKQEQQPRRRRRHHLSSASSGEKPFTISGTAKVKRSSSIAAFLKHKSLHRFHGHQSDSSV